MGGDGRRSGTVTAFDEQVGLGEITADDGTIVPFQCIAIADGTRRIAVGTKVSFESLPKLGRYEAADITADITANITRR
jgi:cold shock CspA family protein